MAFQLSGNVVALHLDNSTPEASVCNHGDMVSTFISTVACHILDLADMHATILLAYVIPISVWKLTITGKNGS